MNGKLENGMAGANVVAVMEIGRELPGVVDIDAVMAAHVHDAAFRRIDFDQKMKAGKVFVFVGQSKVCMFAAADNESVRPVEREFLSLVRPSDDSQCDTHAVNGIAALITILGDEASDGVRDPSFAKAVTGGDVEGGLADSPMFDDFQRQLGVARLRAQPGER